MKILVLNCGSSSIKYALYNMDTREVIASGGAERVGMAEAFVKVKLPNGEKRKIMHDIPEHTEGVKFILSLLTDPEMGAIQSLKEINAVGHRMVHGGEKFNTSVVITPDVITKMEECTDLAPLHNPANLKGVAAITKILPKVPQVGVFDTAFHQTMPDYAYMYALPYEYYEKYGVRRYGFHGTSHRYVAKRACEFFGLDCNNSRIITCHLGGGGSVTAIKNGKSIDTSMGLTPVEGLVMGTRSGDVDLGAITYIMDKEKMDVATANNMINKKSGVLGVSGVSSDMRDILAAMAEGNKRADLAMNMFNYRLLKYIGSYMAVLGGVDAIIFTGGIGEKQNETRDYICRKLEYLGVKFDAELNDKVRGDEVEISTKDSTIRVAVIATDEELTIACDTIALIN